MHMSGTGTLKSPVVICVSGLKNSGKTALIEALIPLLAEEGVRTAVIKHHGHGFGDEIPDKPGTDTYRFLACGACGTVVYDDHTLALVKRQSMRPEELAAFFPDADLILIEGAKEEMMINGKRLPRIVMLRSGHRLATTNGDTTHATHGDVPFVSERGAPTYTTHRDAPFVPTEVDASITHGDSVRRDVACGDMSLPETGALLCAVTDPDYECSTLPAGLPHVVFGDFAAVAALILNFLHHN